MPLRNGNRCHGVTRLRWTSTSTSRPEPAALAARRRRASIIGEKRSWKLTAALRPRSRQSARMAVASSRSRPIGFCSSTAAPSRQRLAARRDGRPGGRARSKTASRSGDRFVERGEGPGRPTCSASAARLAGVEVVEAGDRQAGQPVGRQVRVADDAAGADDDDRARRRRARPGSAAGFPPLSPNAAPPANGTFLCE